MGLLKQLFYGIFISYHLKMKDKVNPSHIILLTYHYEKACYYYKKAYGKEFEERK